MKTTTNHKMQIKEIKKSKKVILLNPKKLEFECKADALNYADDYNIKHSGTYQIRDSYYLKK